MDKGKAPCDKSTCPIQINTQKQQKQQQPPLPTQQQPQQPQPQQHQQQQLQQHKLQNVSSRSLNAYTNNTMLPNYYSRQPLQQLQQQPQHQQQQQHAAPSSPNIFDNERYFDCREHTSASDVNIHSQPNNFVGNMPPYGAPFANNNMTSRHSVLCKNNVCSYVRLSSNSAMPNQNRTYNGVKLSSNSALPNQNRTYNGKLADMQGSHFSIALTDVRAPNYAANSAARNHPSADSMNSVPSRTRLVIQANVTVTAQTNPDKYSVTVTPTTIEIPLEMRMIPPAHPQTHKQNPNQNIAPMHSHSHTGSELIQNQYLMPAGKASATSRQQQPTSYPLQSIPPPTQVDKPPLTTIYKPPPPPPLLTQRVSDTVWLDCESDSSYDRMAPAVKKPVAAGTRTGAPGTDNVSPVTGQGFPGTNRDSPATGPVNPDAPTMHDRAYEESSEGSIVTVQSEETQTPATLMNLLTPNGPRSTFSTQTEKTGVIIDRDDNEYLSALQEMAVNSKQLPIDKMYSNDMSQKAKPTIPPKPKPKKYKLAYPQHRDLDLCTKCRFHPSPLIDEGGNVFCPGKCGCCLCPWITRPTHEQQVEMRHKKVRICKCRDRGTILTDFEVASHCSNISFYDLCPCRDKAEHKHLELYDIPMGEDTAKLLEIVGDKEVYLHEVVEITKI